jgi:PAS domain S-box-containing protein
MDQAELLDVANDAIILTDAHGLIISWNQGACRTYGWEKKEALGQNVHTLLRTDLSGHAQDLESSLKEDSHWEGELEQVRRNGEPIIVASRWTSAGNNPGSARLQINTDITSRRRETAALRESEERYRRFVTEDFTGTLSIRADGHIVTCNPAFANIFGFASIEEALTGNFLELLRSRKDGIELLEMVRQHGIVERHELEMSQRGGDPVYVVARLVGSFAEGELAALQVYLFNDTKRKRLEQQLIQAQKMEGLGTLAGGIAHDFNNILAIILGYTNRLETLRAKPSEVPGAIKVIKDAVERGAALVQQLLTSARQTEARFSSLDLNALVRELEKMLQATFPKMINFDLHLQANLPLITADRSQIHQVLLNLCVNARDAMPHGGTLTLETSMAPGVELTEFFTSAGSQNYACVRVRDTGSGMTRQVKSHIFEPFFTTKERGKGTGLGLSVVYGVVNNHRGFVQVESEPDAGTTFAVYLPFEHSVAESGAATRGTIPRKQNAPQTILLVEDEEMLRELGMTVLESEGYRVLLAKDGMEAVALFQANHDEIGLVVCDLGLPRLGGREAFLKMKEIKPSVRAIVASGYLEPTIRSEMLNAGVIDTIQKPYDFSEMLAKIRSAIGPDEVADDHPELF